MLQELLPLNYISSMCIILVETTYYDIMHMSAIQPIYIYNNNIGYLAMYIICSFSIYIGYLAMLTVVSPYRKQGIGRKLVVMGLERMVKAGCSEIVLETELSNTGAIFLYEKLGFIKEDRLAK